jgi:SpoIID/LytB domain protein
MSHRRCSPYRRAAAALLALASVAAVLTVSPRPAVAAPVVAGPAVAANPSGGTVTLVGAGFGHGRGMGQWGSYGYALEGWDWLQILAHFYPGSGDGTVAADSEMSVRLAAMHGRITVVSGVRPDGSGNVAASTDGFAGRWAAMAAVKVGPQQFDVYGLLAVPAGASGCTTSLTTVADPASGWVKVTPAPVAQPVVFRPGDERGSHTTPTLTDLLALCESDGGQRAYRGQLEAWDDGTQRTVNRLPLEAYLRGVVPRESPPSWASGGGGSGINALRAQAVAARSYAMTQNRFRVNGVLYAKTCDDQDCQVYGGAGRRAPGASTFSRLEDSRTDQAIADTANRVRWVPGTTQVAVTEFSASTGGLTTGGSYAAGIGYGGVVDEGDDVSGNPSHRWTTTLTNAVIEGAYPTIGSLRELVVARRDGVGEWGGRVLSLEIRGSAGTVTVTGEQFRGRTGIKSSWFAVVDDCDGREEPPIGALPAAGPAAFEPVAPLRLLDTRDGTGTSTVAPLRGGCTLALQVGGRSGIPAEATAAALNVTVTGSDGPRLRDRVAVRGRAAAGVHREPLSWP